MKASDIHKADLTPREIHKIVSHDSLNNSYPFLLKVLKKSRDKRITAIDLLILQGKIAEQLIVIEKQISLLKNAANRQDQNREWVSREIYKAQKNMLKKVMDGVAFRLLNFERPVLRLLAHHNQTGHISKGFISEIDKAERIVRNSNNFVILNDLTNFLRFGDLTIVSPEGNFIDEVKTHGKATTAQKAAISKIIEMLNKREFTIDNQTAKYFQIPGKPTTFVNAVGDVIKKSISAKDGIYAERVAPYMWVSSISLTQLKKYYIGINSIPQFTKCPFHLNDYFSSYNSLYYFDLFIPNLLPITVFPFEEEIICQIMSGQIQLKVVISSCELIKSFKGKGWDLTLPSSQLDISKIEDIEKIKEAVRDPKNFIKLSKGAFSFNIPREVLLRIESEFLSVKSIVQEAEFQMNTNKTRQTQFVTTSFMEEGAVWC